MMESIVGNISSSRRLSRTGWVILNRVREEIQALPLFHSPPHSWFDAGHREEEHFTVPMLYYDLLLDIMSATHDFTRAPRDYADDGELAERVLWALVLFQRERIPGAHETCLICGSREMGRIGHWTQDSPRVIMERRHYSSCGYWTLNEISILPCSGGVDSPQLCTRHASWFTRALEAMLGFVDLPVWIHD